MIKTNFQNYLGFRIEYLEQIDSTNLEAFRRAEKGETQGLVLVADFQSQGRGRWGRTWQAEPKSSLLASVLVKPETKPEEMGLVPLVAGIALAQAIENLSGFKPGLVWPNDLFGAKGKIAGILVESKFEGMELKFIVIGTGVNLSQKKSDFPSELQNRASSIFIETKKIISRDQLLFRYLEELSYWLKKLEEKQFSEIIENYSKWDIIKGKELKILKGEEQISGTGAGIDLRGRLIINREGEELFFSAGEVNWVRGVKDAFSD